MKTIRQASVVIACVIIGAALGAGENANRDLVRSLRNVPLVDVWTARAGYIYLDTPTSTSTTLPVAAEDDQSVVSIGLGYDDEAHSFDIAYAIGIFDTLTVDDNVVPPVNGKYDFSAHLISLAYGYRF